ncbi:MAG: hypothetical protein ABIR34_04945 [Marmoricola sp.]
MRHQEPGLTRRSMHGIAELVLAGPQYAASQSIRLRVTPGGFGTVSAPDLRVDGLELVTATARLPLGGTYAGLAHAAGVEARALRDVYGEGPGVADSDPIVVDPEAVGVILEAFARGDAAMRAFAPDQDPVIWPEHFDIGISVDQVNYGVSPGDVHVAEPYAYVGPWSSREGAFWNTPFGAARPLTELRDVDALVAYFAEGARQAVADRSPTG